MDDTSLPFIIPNTGNSITGNKEVIARGTISETHHSAINIATARVYVILGLELSNCTKKTKYKKRTGAIKKTPSFIFRPDASILELTINYFKTVNSIEDDVNTECVCVLKSLFLAL